MSKYAIDKTMVMTALSYYCGIKGFRFGPPYQVIKTISTWADEFIEQSNKSYIPDKYQCLQEAHKFVKYKIKSNSIGVDYKCPRCKNNEIRWQINYVGHIYCPECHYIFDEKKTDKILEEVVQVDSRPTLYTRPYGIHLRTRKNPYLLTRRALSILTGIEETNYGTVKKPYEDMSVMVYENKNGIYSPDYSIKPPKTLAQALYDKDPVSYTDGWTVIDYSGEVLYIDLTTQAWEENYPYYTPLIIGNCCEK